MVTYFQLYSWVTQSWYKEVLPTFIYVFPDCFILCLEPDIWVQVLAMPLANCVTLNFLTVLCPGVLILQVRACLLVLWGFFCWFCWFSAWSVILSTNNCNFVPSIPSHYLISFSYHCFHVLICWFHHLSHFCWWIVLWIVDPILQLLCVHGNCWSDARHCRFYMLGPSLLM